MWCKKRTYQPSFPSQNQWDAQACLQVDKALTDYSVNDLPQESERTSGTGGRGDNQELQPGMVPKLGQELPPPSWKCLVAQKASRLRRRQLKHSSAIETTLAVTKEAPVWGNSQIFLWPDCTPCSSEGSHGPPSHWGSVKLFKGALFFWPSLQPPLWHTPALCYGFLCRGEAHHRNTLSDSSLIRQSSRLSWA